MDIVDQDQTAQNEQSELRCILSDKEIFSPQNSIEPTLLKSGPNALEKSIDSYQAAHSVQANTSPTRLL